MCTEAPACACKTRIASLGSVAAGALVASAALFVADHLVLLAEVLAVVAVTAAAGACVLVWAVRRSASLAVVHWPSRVVAPARVTVRAVQVHPAPAPLPGAPRAIAPVITVAPEAVFLPAAGERQPWPR